MTPYHEAQLRDALSHLLDVLDEDDDQWWWRDAAERARGILTTNPEPQLDARELRPCTRDHAHGTTHYHPTRAMFEALR